MNKNIPVIGHEADICVVGGGMAGLIAAVAAARHGAKVLLMQDRPVLGGNASSEIRMWIRGADGKENRETGILQEIELENIYRNPMMNYSLWDSVLYSAAAREKNIEILMNTSCLDCAMEGGRVASVTGWQLTTYSFHRVTAALYLDCSGDSILAPLTGAAYRVGREAKDEFGEYAGVDVPDRKVMSSSCLIQARETDHPCSFIPPEWASVFPDDEAIHLKDHDFINRDTNFWWMELGGEEDTIADSESIKERLLKLAFGVWDHIKNHGDHGAENWELEWVGFLPGKRESRRYEGEYMLNQSDLEEGHEFPDTVAFGGWTMDDHDPRGFERSGYSSRHIRPKVPYAIPFRCLYSRNVENLMFAGRNISATHMAMSSTRVMATCSVIGQAAGTGAALCIRHGCLPRDVAHAHIGELRQELLEDGCMLPGSLRKQRGGFSLSLPEEEAAVLQNGWERPRGDAQNRVLLPSGSAFSLTPDAPVCGRSLRLALDPDFSRETISTNRKYQKFAMRGQIFRDQKPLSMPAPLLRSACVRCVLEDGSETRFRIGDNRRPLLRIPLPDGAVRVFVEDLVPWGGEQAGLYGVDLV